MRPFRATSAGFTLIEALAAMAIAAAVLVSAASLMRGIGGSFQRGLSAAAEAERVLLAADRLAADFAAARFVVAGEGGAVRTLFTGLPDAVTFVSGAAPFAVGGGEEVVALSVEREGAVSRLVRRRLVFTGAASFREEAVPGDPVTLLEGAFDIVLSYGLPASDGAVTWSDTWLARSDLPRFTRIAALDPVTGEDRLAGLVLVVRADAPPGCVADDAGPECLSARPASSPAGRPAP